MLSLNDREWRPFFLTELFPTIQRGKRLKSEDHIPGKMPYVSSSAMSNGVDNFIANTEKVRIFSNCLSLANSGSVGSSFYEPFAFVASDHITHLKNERYNKYHYLFIAALTNRLSQKYNFNREINDNRISREKIMLPVDETGKPDLDFMEAYCKEREQQLIEKYKLFIGRIAQWEVIQPVNSAKWKPFIIGELFDRFIPGKSKGRNHLQTACDGYSYLGATNRNNGVLSFVQVDKNVVQSGNAIGFIKNGNGSAGYAIYKRENFVSTSDIIFAYASWINKYIGLFITTCSDMSQDKYNHGYKWTMDRLLKSSIMLPADEQGNPDYAYMEQYGKWMMVQMYQCYFDYINLR